MLKFPKEKDPKYSGRKDMMPPKHEYWKRGLYCSKCDNELYTSSKIKLWLWAFYHWIKCLGLSGADSTSILLLPRPEIIDLTDQSPNQKATS